MDEIYQCSRVVMNVMSNIKQEGGVTAFQVSHLYDILKSYINPARSLSRGKTKHVSLWRERLVQGASYRKGQICFIKQDLDLYDDLVPMERLKELKVEKVKASEQKAKEKKSTTKSKAKADDDSEDIIPNIDEPMWYVMNVYMGMEDFVKRTIDQYRADPKFGTQIMEIHVPVKKEVKSAGRQLKIKETPVYPGYAFIKMKMNREIHDLIRAVPRVSGFTGRYVAKRGTVPIPMKEEEIARMLKQKEFESEKEPDISNIQFRQGDIVELLDGTWKHARGKVNSVKTKMLTVTIAQFGNPVRLSVPQTACRLISKEELAREEAETEEEQLRSFKRDRKDAGDLTMKAALGDRGAVKRDQPLKTSKGRKQEKELEGGEDLDAWLSGLIEDDKKVSKVDKMEEGRGVKVDSYEYQQKRSQGPSEQAKVASELEDDFLDSLMKELDGGPIGGGEEKKEKRGKVKKSRDGNKEDEDEDLADWFRKLDGKREGESVEGDGNQGGEDLSDFFKNLDSGSKRKEATLVDEGLLTPDEEEELEGWLNQQLEGGPKKGKDTGKGKGAMPLWDDGKPLTGKAFPEGALGAMDFSGYGTSLGAELDPEEEKELNAWLAKFEGSGSVIPDDELFLGDDEGAEESLAKFSLTPQEEEEMNKILGVAKESEGNNAKKSAKEKSPKKDGASKKKASKKGAVVADDDLDLGDLEALLSNQRFSRGGMSNFLGEEEEREEEMDMEFERDVNGGGRESEFRRRQEPVLSKEKLFGLDLQDNDDEESDDFGYEIADDTDEGLYGINLNRPKTYQGDLDEEDYDPLQGPGARGFRDPYGNEENEEDEDDINFHLGKPTSKLRDGFVYDTPPDDLMGGYKGGAGIAEFDEVFGGGAKGWEEFKGGPGVMGAAFSDLDKMFEGEEGFDFGGEFDEEDWLGEAVKKKAGAKKAAGISSGSTSTSSSKSSSSSSSSSKGKKKVEKAIEGSSTGAGKAAKTGKVGGKSKSSSTTPKAKSNSVKSPSSEGEAKASEKGGGVGLKLDSMKVADLKAELKSRGLPVGGTKGELQKRLAEALGN